MLRPPPRSTLFLNTSFFFFFLMTRRPPRSPLFPSPPLFRSRHGPRFTLDRRGGEPEVEGEPLADQPPHTQLLRRHADVTCSSLVLGGHEPEQRIDPAE